MLNDKSEGSRLEISGVKTLSDAEEALAMLRNRGAWEGNPIHCYLAGDSFAFWVDTSENPL